MNKTYKVAVIGSRSIQDKSIIFNYLDSKKDKINTIISGKATGPDFFSEEWANLNSIPTLIFPAKWKDENGNVDKGAGYRRNHDIIKACEICVCFYDGISKGSKHSMELCKKYDKKLIIIDCNKER